VEDLLQLKMLSLLQKLLFNTGKLQKFLNFPKKYHFIPLHFIILEVQLRKKEMLLIQLGQATKKQYF